MLAVRQSCQRLLPRRRHAHLGYVHNGPNGFDPTEHLARTFRCVYQVLVLVQSKFSTYKLQLQQYGAV